MYNRHRRLRFLRLQFHFVVSELIIAVYYNLLISYRFYYYYHQYRYFLLNNFFAFSVLKYMYHNKLNGAVHQQLKCLDHDLVARSKRLNYEGGPSAADRYPARALV